METFGKRRHAFALPLRSDCRRGRLTQNRAEHRRVSVEHNVRIVLVLVVVVGRSLRGACGYFDSKSHRYATVRGCSREMRYICGRRNSARRMSESLSELYSGMSSRCRSMDFPPSSCYASVRADPAIPCTLDIAVICSRVCGEANVLDLAWY